ncbi:TPA: hypothetical protein MYR02_004778 [Klebsiella pneumoniae]|uniref:hypothetical protein n=1 Tax=Klebsiella pneumoniae TaxID=573 RepID=UPI00388D9A40|nr:hypothetical protein [Klebsiella pneumoniae]HCC8473957.1 hypothetical protein [Klebsiella pneumoniae]
MNFKRDVFAILLALLPLVFGLLPLDYETNKIAFYLVPFIITSIVVVLDIWHSKEGKPHALIGIIITPFYLWKRSRWLVLVWILAFGGAWLMSESDEQNQNLGIACNIVSQLAHDKYGNQAAQCVRVKVTEKVTKEFWKGVATMDNGNDLDVTIKFSERDGSPYLYVTAQGL